MHEQDSLAAIREDIKALARIAGQLDAVAIVVAMTSEDRDDFERSAEAIADCLIFVRQLALVRALSNGSSDPSEIRKALYHVDLVMAPEDRRSWERLCIKPTKLIEQYIAMMM